MRWKLLLSIPVILVLCLVIPAMADVPVGDPAPDFTLKDASGDLHSLSGFQGKVVLINFWQDI
jgi:peroxiredoxin